MAGRDLFANASPQYLQQIGSKKKPVENTTLVNDLAEPVPRENPLVDEIQGNLKALEPKPEFQSLPTRMQNSLTETFGRPDEMAALMALKRGAGDVVQGIGRDISEPVISGLGGTKDVYDRLVRSMQGNETVSAEEDELKRRQ